MMLNYRWVLAAVGSAIVLPLMGKIEKRAYGLDSELPSVVIGSASIDNLLCICAFHVTLTIAFTLGEQQAVYFSMEFELTNN